MLLREQFFCVYFSLEVLFQNSQYDSLLLLLPDTPCQQHVTLTRRSRALIRLILVHELYWFLTPNVPNHHQPSAAASPEKLVPALQVCIGPPSETDL